MRNDEVLPEVGKEYNVFDDGKININRMYTVLITEVIPMSKIDEDTLNKWRNALERNPLLYKDPTDYFVKYTNGENDEDGVFVRMNRSGWFGIGDFWNSGRLDIDGSLTNIIL